MTDHPTFSGKLSGRKRTGLIILAIMGAILVALAVTYLLPPDLWSEGPPPIVNVD